MGNCLKCEEGATWVEDEKWEAEQYESPRRGYGGRKAEDEEETMALRGTEAVASSTEVKIKITKKQLAELLRGVDGQGLPIHDVLTHLLSVGEPCVHHDQARTWRPALQSIPEISE